MAAIFPPANQGGVPPGPNVCNGYSPQHQTLGEGPLYIANDCTTTLTDCQANSWTSEILAAVDKLGYAYNTVRVDNLGTALLDTIDNINNHIAAKVSRAGDTMEGPLELAGDPVDPMQAATKNYVDTEAAAAADACCSAVRAEFATADAALQADINTRVLKAGDQMTGALILNADPTVPLGAATKEYVDQIVGGITVAPEPPTGVPPDRLWWDSRRGALFVRYDDGNSVQWVQACSSCDIDGGPAPSGDFLPLTGGTLIGPLYLAANPTMAFEAVTKGYVDALHTLVDQLTQEVADLTARVEALEGP